MDDWDFPIGEGFAPPAGNAGDGDRRQERNRNHGRPRGRTPKVAKPASSTLQTTLAKRKRDARRLARMTPEQRALWRV